MPTITATPWACQIIPKGGNAFEAYHSISTSVPVGLHYFHFQWNFPLAERAPLNLKRGLGHPGNRKLFWTLFIAPTTLWTSERSKFTKSSDGASRELILLQVQTWFFFFVSKVLWKRVSYMYLFIMMTNFVAGFWPSFGGEIICPVQQVCLSF